jgi:hypothetical protein
MAVPITGLEAACLRKTDAHLCCVMCFILCAICCLILLCVNKLIVNVVNYAWEHPCSPYTRQLMPPSSTPRTGLQPATCSRSASEYLIDHCASHIITAAAGPQTGLLSPFFLDFSRVSCACCGPVCLFGGAHQRFMHGDQIIKTDTQPISARAKKKRQIGNHALLQRGYGLGIHEGSEAVIPV